VALSEATFNELAPFGVGVSVLCPGFIDTEILRSSERNRPEAVRTQRPDLYATDEARRMQALLAGALAPARVGALVLSAIRERRFWIRTHPEFEPAVRSRCENVLAERDPRVTSPSPRAAVGAAAAPRTPGDSARRG
jgi:NAD(P)-dependent dehydrogenase (short-subunit alcohol dehydrogenase family)